MSRESIPIQVCEYLGNDTVLFQGNSGAIPPSNLEPPAPEAIPPMMDPINGIIPPPPGAPLSDIAIQQPSAPPAIVITPARLEILDQIEDFRYSRFAKRIQEEYPGIFDDLRIAPDEDLNQRLEVMNGFISKKNLSKQAEILFKGGLSLADQTFKTIGWDIEGASEIISEDEDILDIVEELRIKYRSKSRVTPEIRLAMGVFMIYSKVHNANRKKNAAAEALKLRDAQDRINSHLNTIDRGLEAKFREI